MDKYSVKLLSKAVRDLEQIYIYISEMLLVPDISIGIIENIESTILSLGYFPYRGAMRRVGRYANKGYRQLFVKNFTVLYRIDEVEKVVIVVTVKYTPSNL